MQKAAATLSQMAMWSISIWVVLASKSATIVPSSKPSFSIGVEWGSGVHPAKHGNYGGFESGPAYFLTDPVHSFPLQTSRFGL